MLARRVSFSGLFLSFFLVGLTGCDTKPAPAPVGDDPPPKKADKQPPARKVQLAQNLYLEVQGEKRRVVISATVCLQRGTLELLLTRKNTKEHEAVLTVDVDAREIHKALILAKAEPGSPVKFDPKYQPASGQEIKITVEFMEKGKVVSLNAREWVRHATSKQTLNTNWVFGGSRLMPNPLDKDKLIYLANDGDVVCVSNFEDAMLDLPIKSSKDNTELQWETNAEKIPAVGTPVTVYMEPLPARKK